MSTRLARGGRLINRRKAVTVTFNGRNYKGFEGDTLASALLANDQMLVGRSFKYHRPRGIVASGAEEPNGLVNLGQGGGFEPNARVTTTEVFEGLTRRYGKPAWGLEVITVDGLPVGLQVVGRHYAEQLLLDIALTMERTRPWPLVAPSSAR